MGNCSKCLSSDINNNNNQIVTNENEIHIVTEA